MKPSRKRKWTENSKERKRRKLHDLEVAACSFTPHKYLPRELKVFTLQGLQDFQWNRFLRAFTMCSEEEADWFEFPNVPHTNTLRMLTDRLLADCTEEGEIVSYKNFEDANGCLAKSAVQDSDEIDIFDDCDEENSDEIDVFPCEDDSQFVHRADQTDVKVVCGPPKRQAKLVKSKDIFAVLAETKKNMQTENIQRIVCWGVFQYEWLLLHVGRYIYTHYQWGKKPLPGRCFRSALSAFTQSMNVTREILRLKSRKKRRAIFLKEVSEEQLARLQLNCPKNVPKKFWAQRYRLFSKFDEGIRLTSDTAWFSVTPELIADHVAKRFQNAELVVDAFCGQGGNSIALAKVCKQVISIDILQESVEACLHNAAVYGVADKIKPIVGNFFEQIPKLKPELIFLAPPWGGMDYEQGIFDVENCEGINLFEVVQAILDISPNASMAITLPRNCDFVQLCRLSKQFDFFEIEQNFLWGKCKMWTVYVGPFFASKKAK